MIVERNIFYLKFGKAREALEAMKGMMSTVGGNTGNMRMLTDLTGDSYRLILEMTAKDLAELEKGRSEGDMTKWREHYQKFIPLCERSYREILNVVG